MVQRMMIRRNENEELFDGVREILSLNLRRVAYNNIDVSREVVQFNARINLNTDNTWTNEARTINGQAIVVAREDFEVNKHMHHAFRLLGRRTVEGTGNATTIKFTPRTGNTITQTQADRMIRTLIRVRNLGFSMIYSGYNSSDEYIVGACITGKVPQYARRDGEYMSIQYAEEVITRLAMLSDMVREDMESYDNLRDIQRKRKNYPQYIAQSDRRFARRVAEQAEIVDIAMQGMKKKDKVRAVLNLVIDKSLDYDFDEERVQNYRDWVSANPYTEEDIEATEAQIQLLITRMSVALRNVKCPVTEGQRIFNELL